MNPSQQILNNQNVFETNYNIQIDARGINPYDHQMSEEQLEEPINQTTSVSVSNLIEQANQQPQLNNSKAYLQRKKWEISPQQQIQAKENQKKITQFFAPKIVIDMSKIQSDEEMSEESELSVEKQEQWRPSDKTDPSDQRCSLAMDVLGQEMQTSQINKGNDGLKQTSLVNIFGLGFSQNNNIGHNILKKELYKEFKETKTKLIEQKLKTSIFIATSLTYDKKQQQLREEQEDYKLKKNQAVNEVYMSESQKRDQIQIQEQYQRLIKNESLQIDNENHQIQELRQKIKAIDGKIKELLLDKENLKKEIHQKEGRIQNMNQAIIRTKIAEIKVESQRFPLKLQQCNMDLKHQLDIASEEEKKIEAIETEKQEIIQNKVSNIYSIAESYAVSKYQQENQQKQKQRLLR
eukprot:403372693